MIQWLYDNHQWIASTCHIIRSNVASVKDIISVCVSRRRPIGSTITMLLGPSAEKPVKRSDISMSLVSHFIAT